MRRIGPISPIGLILWAAAAALGIFAGPVAAQQPGWRVGLAATKITPEQPVFLAGYSARNKPFTKVDSDLFAKALALEDAKGERFVIVTSDLIGFRKSVAEPICERLAKSAGLRREQILLNSSHTHTGPTLGLEPARMEGTPSADALRTVEYTRRLQDKVVATVEESLKRMEPAKLSMGSGVVHFVMNRREFTPKGVILGVNPRGLADRGVPVLRIDGADGKLRAVLFGAASHNTTLGPQNYEVSGDYAGHAQAFVEKQHRGAMALFILGCAGDANPYPRGSHELSRAHGKELGQEVCRVLQGKLRPIHGPLTVAFDYAELPLQQLPRADIEKLAGGKRGVHSDVAKQMLKILERGDKLATQYSCPVAVAQFGDDLTLVGLSGEVVVDYVTLVEKSIGPNKLWIAGYCNDVFGYLPSAKVLSEGGYETRGLISGGTGFFHPQAQDVLAAKVAELANKVGRSRLSAER